tara:strand:+ start:107 stop:421 length:315 start_codon:yes stop_codon:yes gene_type:complete
MKNKYFFLISTFLLLNACQTLQDGLAGKKNKNSDEFLIEKKNPLEIPPDFGLLPEPKNENEESNQAEKIDEDIEKLFQSDEIIKDPETQDKSAEDFVLKQIKKN